PQLHDLRGLRHGRMEPHAAGEAAVEAGRLLGSAAAPELQQLHRLLRPVRRLDQQLHLARRVGAQRRRHHHRAELDAVDDTAWPDWVSVSATSYTGETEGSWVYVPHGTATVRSATDSVNHYSHGIYSLYAVCSGW